MGADQGHQFATFDEPVSLSGRCERRLNDVGTLGAEELGTSVPRRGRKAPPRDAVAGDSERRWSLCNFSWSCMMLSRVHSSLAPDYQHSAPVRPWY